RCSGKVFQAIWHGKETVVKVCDLSKDWEYKQELLNEVAIYDDLKVLQGNFILKLIDSGYFWGKMFFGIATEFAGSPLNINPLHSQEYAKAVEALSKIHEHRVLHNDLHFDNILVHRINGKVKVSIIDFGFSKQTD